MNWQRYRIIISFVVLLFLSACGPDNCIRDCDSYGHCKRECGAGHCIDADDWGMPKIDVSAESKDLNPRGHALGQYVDGIDSGQVLLDATKIPLVITVAKQDKWTSWFGGAVNKKPDGTLDRSGIDGGRTVPERECLYILANNNPAAQALTRAASEALDKAKIARETATALANAATTAKTSATNVANAISQAKGLPGATVSSILTAGHVVVKNQEISYNSAQQATIDKTRLAAQALNTKTQAQTIYNAANAALAVVMPAATAVSTSAGTAAAVAGATPASVAAAAAASKATADTSLTTAVEALKTATSKTTLDAAVAAVIAAETAAVAAERAATDKATQAAALEMGSKTYTDLATINASTVLTATASAAEREAYATALEKVAATATAAANIPGAIQATIDAATAAKASAATARTAATAARAAATTARTEADTAMTAAVTARTAASSLWALSSDVTGATEASAAAKKVSDAAAAEALLSRATAASVSEAASIALTQTTPSSTVKDALTIATAKLSDSTSKSATADIAKSSAIKAEAIALEVKTAAQAVEDAASASILTTLNAIAANVATTAADRAIAQTAITAVNNAVTATNVSRSAENVARASEAIAASPTSTAAQKTQATADRQNAIEKAALLAAALTARDNAIAASPNIRDEVFAKMALAATTTASGTTTTAATTAEIQAAEQLAKDAQTAADTAKIAMSSNFAQDLTPKTLKLTKDFYCPTAPAPSEKVLLTPSAPWPVPDTFADCIVPCNYKNGMGLYVGLAPNNDSQASPNDVVLAYHIPDAKVPDARTLYVDDPNKTPSANEMLKYAAEIKDGYLVRGIPEQELPGARTGDRLYFKIVDRTYLDNSGGYHVKIKEGTRNPNPGPLEKIANTFVEPIKIVMQRVYMGIVANPEYINFVRALLVMYMAFFGFTIMVGGFGEIKKDVLVRMFKVILIIQLISVSSWDFFYNYFFAFFIDGTQQLAGLLTNPFGDVDPKNSWYAIDQVVAKLWSPETWSKIASTLLSDPIGFIFIITMFVAVALFMVAAVEALIVYLVAFGTIGILIMMAPLFLICMLFEKTKGLTKEWFDQMMVVSLQQIILLTALGMFSAIIVTLLQRLVGFQVCWNAWLPINIGAIHIYDFKAWMPDVNISADGLANVWMDANNDGIRDINETGRRYIDAPYLDPVLDKLQLGKLGSAGIGGQFLSIIDLLTFIASIYLMRVFMGLVPEIANVLKSGGAVDSSNIFGAGTSLMKSMSQAIQGITGGGMNTLEGAYNSARDSMSKKAMRKDIAASLGGAGTTAATTAPGVKGGAGTAEGAKFSDTKGGLTAAAANAAAANSSAQAAKGAAKGANEQADGTSAAGAKPKDPATAAAERRAAIGALAEAIGALPKDGSQDSVGLQVTTLKALGSAKLSAQDLAQLVANDNLKKNGFFDKDGVQKLMDNYHEAAKSGKSTLTAEEARTLNENLSNMKLMEGELRAARAQANSPDALQAMQADMLDRVKAYKDSAPEREAAEKAAKIDEDARNANADMMKQEAAKVAEAKLAEDIREEIRELTKAQEERQKEFELSKAQVLKDLEQQKDADKANIIMMELESAQKAMALEHQQAIAAIEKKHEVAPPEAPAAVASAAVEPTGPAAVASSPEEKGELSAALREAAAAHDLKMAEQARNIEKYAVRDIEKDLAAELAKEKSDDLHAQFAAAAREVAATEAATKIAGELSKKHSVDDISAALALSVAEAPAEQQAPEPYKPEKPADEDDPLKRIMDILTSQKEADATAAAIAKRFEGQDAKAKAAQAAKAAEEQAAADRAKKEHEDEERRKREAELRRQQEEKPKG